jgi:hypothetical protein
MDADKSSLVLIKIILLHRTGKDAVIVRLYIILLKLGSRNNEHRIKSRTLDL